MARDEGPAGAARSPSWRALCGCLALATASTLLAGCGSGKDPEICGRAGAEGVGCLEPSGERAGSFLVIGDWGWDESIHGSGVCGIESRTCQQAIADAMDAKMTELGDVKFVINVGDSFYPGGVASKTDPGWDAKWRDVYSPRTRSVPWYSVYGNHDYPGDPCACSPNPEDCAQVNADISDTDYFYMPDTSWSLQHPELGLEVVALDLNYEWVNQTCPWAPCEEECRQNFKARSEAAWELFYDRAANSTASNLLVFSHYPTDYFLDAPRFLEELSDNSRHGVVYFGGHRHNVDNSSTESIAPNTNWLVGGGGGWGCEGYGREQGFVVGEISRRGYNVTTYPVLVNYSLCCSEPASSSARRLPVPLAAIAAFAFAAAFAALAIFGWRSSGRACCSEGRQLFRRPSLA